MLEVFDPLTLVHDTLATLVLTLAVGFVVVPSAEVLVA